LPPSLIAQGLWPVAKKKGLAIGRASISILVHSAGTSANAG
jgi:hypothetical protein